MNRYSSEDSYRVLATIQKKLRDLACQGRHADGAISYQDLCDFVRKETEASCIRAAKAKADRDRRSRAAKRGDASA